MHAIYLDHNSTTPIDPTVAEEIARCHAAGYVNPASPHTAGRRARQALEEARTGIGQLLGARVDHSPSDRVIFTSGGTESNNLALRGMCGRPPGRILISAVEHPSLAGAADFLARSGFDVRRIPVNREGIVSLDALRQQLDDDTRLVSIMWGNHETGVIQPVAECAQICASRRVPFHTDAVQAAGKIGLSFSQAGVAALSATAHKFHGPRGVGVLLVRHDVPLKPILFGGSQQLGTRPGTESVALARGMWHALRLCHEHADRQQEHLRSRRDELQERLAAGCPSAEFAGARVARLPQTLNVSFPGLDRQALLMALDRAGIACSTGSACASGSSDPSPVLLAMGCRGEVVQGAIRLSVGARTTAAEIQIAAERILRVVGDLEGLNRTKF